MYFKFHFIPVPTFDYKLTEQQTAHLLSQAQ